ncbi:MAG: hypothetical protein FDZ75_04200 [Actinobacteria bacterium]|nr:MAG: hypothetical protein FDZ75_04200 [Actinomycetota bacterium]
MLKRLEVYVDSGLLSFVLGVVALLALSIVGRVLGLMLGGGQGVMVASMITIVVLSLLIGLALAVWVSRALHKDTVHDPLTADESRKVVWVDLALVVIAPLLGVAYATIGTSTPVVWLSVAVLLLALATALVVDAIADLAKPHKHLVMDVLRIAFIGLLAFSLVASVAQRAPLGSDQDVSPWVVWVTIGMIFAALVASVYDEFVSRKARSQAAKTPMAPVA